MRFIDEAILAAEIGIDDAQIVPDGFAGLIEEDHAAGLVCQLVERLLPIGEERFGFGAEDVNCYVCFLADVDVVFEADVAGVVDAVGEEQDEVAGEWVGGPERIATGFVDRVKESCTAQSTGVVSGDVGRVAVRASL